MYCHILLLALHNEQGNLLLDFSYTTTHRALACVCHILPHLGHHRHTASIMGAQVFDDHGKGIRARKDLGDRGGGNWRRSLVMMVMMMTPHQTDGACRNFRLLDRCYPLNERHPSCRISV